MARPFVLSMAPDQVADAVAKNDAYMAARATGSIKVLADYYGIDTLTMRRRIAAYKEKKRVPRIRSS